MQDEKLDWTIMIAQKVAGQDADGCKNENSRFQLLATIRKVLKALGLKIPRNSEMARLNQKILEAAERGVAKKLRKGDVLAFLAALEVLRTGEVVPKTLAKILAHLEKVGKSQKAK